jgi:hypothetical protein
MNGMHIGMGTYFVVMYNQPKVHAKLVAMCSTPYKFAIICILWLVVNLDIKVEMLISRGIAYIMYWYHIYVTLM